jgi:hypothetical protein
VEVAVFSLSKDKNEGFHPLRTIIHDTQTQMFSLPDSMSSVPSPDWVLGDYISQAEHPYTRPTEQDNRNSIYNSLTVSDIYENLEPNSILCPDLGFDSDFGPRSVHSFPEPVFNPSTFSPANVSQTKHPLCLFIHTHWFRASFPWSIQHTCETIVTHIGGRLRFTKSQRVWSATTPIRCSQLPKLPSKPSRMLASSR